MQRATGKVIPRVQTRVTGGASRGAAAAGLGSPAPLMRAPMVAAATGGGM